MIMDANSILEMLTHVPEWLNNLSKLVDAWTPKAMEIATQIQNTDPKVLFIALSMLGIVIGIVKGLVKIAALFAGIVVLLAAAKYLNIALPIPG